MGGCAIVTGAGSGIGRATACRLAREGWPLALIDVSVDGLAETRRLVGEQAPAVPFQADITVRPAVEAAIASAIEQFGGIRALVCCAGINPMVPTSLDIDEAFFDRVMDVNLKGMFFCNQAAIRFMVDHGGGAIVNLASVSGLIGWGGTSVYSASKGGVIALTKALAIEYAQAGIRVNAICPGAVRTPMVEDNQERLPDPEAARRANAAHHPVGRIAEPEEIAEAVAYLVSASSTFITGSCLTIDGGLTAQ